MLISFYQSTFRIKGLCFAFLMAAGSTAIAQDSDFDSFQNQYQQGYQSMLEEFENGVARSMEDYEKYEEAYKEEFNKFKKEMKEKWGDFRERSKKQWVEYKEDGDYRLSVDFEKGEGKVEVLADSPEEAEEAEQQMDEKVNKALEAKPTREGFETEKLPNKEVSEEPALEGQLPKDQHESTEEHAEKLAETETKTKKVKGDDGETRYVVYVDFSLADDHLQKRARKVEEEVYKFAQENKLDPALVFAIIHTESYYNPTAASHANAYGLMQLVPSSGGRDAYKAAFNDDGVPTKEFLFKPNNNIRLGCVYVDILTNRYFKGIENQETREYLAISAYNTGAGNVAKAYIGSTNLSRAKQKMNNMNPEQNYELLRKELPYKETRDYLKKVTERRELYNSWKKEGETKGK